MPIAELRIPPPPSLNETLRGTTKGARRQRHARKRRDQGDLAMELVAAGVPRPIPGERVHATAELLFPQQRDRDEDNWRTGLQKALGDALAPHDPDAAFRWLPRDTPEHFTMGAVTFGQTEHVEWKDPETGRVRRRRRPAVAIVTLSWGDDLPAAARAADLVERAAEVGARLDAAIKRAEELLGRLEGAA